MWAAARARRRARHRRVHRPPARHRHARWGGRPGVVGHHGPADVVGRRPAGGVRVGGDDGLRLRRPGGDRGAGCRHPPGGAAAARRASASWCASWSRRSSASPRSSTRWVCSSRSSSSAASSLCCSRSPRSAGSPPLPDRAARRDRPRTRSGRRPATIAVAALAGLAVVAGVVWLARPGRDVDAAEAATGATGTVCNGHAELCDRRFDEVAYVASHNAMSVGHRAGLVPRRAGRLDSGPARPRGAGAARRRVVRDTCRHGRAHGAGKLRRGARHRRGGARTGGRRRRSAHRRLGRRRRPPGPRRGSCATVCAKPGRLRSSRRSSSCAAGWSANPDEVVTLFIEDHVDAALIAADVEAAGLLDFVYDPSPASRGRRSAR